LRGSHGWQVERRSRVGESSRSEISGVSYRCGAFFLN
jgi:hypothetical protein